MSIRKYINAGIIEIDKDLFLKCPKCGFKETTEEKFIDTEVGCEDCGSHSAIECPKCDKRYDHVYHGKVCGECGLLLDSYEECPTTLKIIG